VVTMYNEDEGLFLRTWRALQRNIAYMCRKHGGAFGPEGWRKVVVCIVADGINDIPLIYWCYGCLSNHLPSITYMRS
jgi:chitin synthase